MNEVQNSLEKWMKNYSCNGKLIPAKCCIMAALILNDADFLLIHCCFLTCEYANLFSIIKRWHLIQPLVEHLG